MKRDNSTTIIHYYPFSARIIPTIIPRDFHSAEIPLLLIISFVLRLAKVAYTSALMSTVLLERLKRLELLERLDR